MEATLLQVLLHSSPHYYILYQYKIGYRFVMDQAEDDQTDYSQSQVVQSTTLKTIRNLKKLQHSQTNLEDDENDGSERNQTQQTFVAENNSRIQKQGSRETVKPSSKMKILNLKKRASLNQKENDEDTDKRGESAQQVQRYLEKAQSLECDTPLQNTLEARITKGQVSSHVTTPGVMMYGKQRIRSGTRNARPTLVQVRPPETNMAMKREFIQVDMNQALNLVLQKSKVMRERIEQLQLSGSQISTYIANNTHYRIALNSLLQKLIADGKLNAALSNIPKSSLAKIEQQAIQHIDKCQRVEKINEMYDTKARIIRAQLERNLKEVQERISNETLF